MHTQGFSLVDQELEVACCNVSAHASRTSVEQLTERMLPALLDTAAQISADLGAVPPL